MTFEQLQVLRELAKSHSMTLCASNLNMSKSSVSRAIAQLENELSVQLFVKSRGGSYLTPAGEQVLAHANCLLDEYDLIKCIDNAPSPENSLTICYDEAHLNATNTLVNLLQEKRNINSVQIMNIMKPHTNETILASKPDVVFDAISEAAFKDIENYPRYDDYKKYKEKYFGYIINQSPICVLAAKGNPAPALKKGNAEVAGNTLKSLSLILQFAMTSDGNEIAPAFKRVCDNWGLTSQAKITHCNSVSVIRNMLPQGYVMLSDEFGIRQLFGKELKTGEFKLYHVVPEETILRYALIRKDSPFLSDISEAFATMHNQSNDEFKRFERVM